MRRRVFLHRRDLAPAVAGGEGLGGVEQHLLVFAAVAPLKFNIVAAGELGSRLVLGVGHGRTPVSPPGIAANADFIRASARRYRLPAARSWMLRTCAASALVNCSK